MKNMVKVVVSAGQYETAAEKKNMTDKKRWEEAARKRHAKRYGTDQAANLRQMVAEG